MRHHFSTITNRPEPCRAKEGNCRYAEHSDSPQELIDAHEKKMEASFDPIVLKKTPKVMTYAPPRPETAELTLEEVREAMGRLGDKESQRSIVGYSLMGSIIYGLETESSDRDIVIFTDNMKINSIHRQYDDGLDMKLNSLGYLAQKIQDASPNEVDILRSGRMELLSPYRHFISNMRFDPYKYYISYKSHIKSLSLNKNGRPPEGTNDRRKEDKAIKVSIRDAFMMKRVRESGQWHTTYFNDEQREQFYKEYHDILEFRSNPEVTGEDVIERILQVSQEDEL